MRTEKKQQKQHISVAAVNLGNGPLLTIFAIVLLQGFALFYNSFINFTPLPLTGIAAAVLLLTVIIVAWYRGIVPALLSVLVAILYLSILYATPGRLFHYSPDNLYRVFAISIVLPLIAIIVGYLKTKMLIILNQERTARRKAERSVETVKQRERYKDTFIGIASHELKTPVTSIKALIQVLHRKLEKDGDNESTRYLQKVDNQLNSLNMLITDLLDVSNLSNGTVPLHKEVFDMGSLVEEKVDELAGIAQEHAILIKNTNKRAVDGDKTRIGQVLTNLLTNAIKYSPPHTNITVTIQSDYRNVAVTVQDSGIGVAKKYHKQVFDSFFRVHTGKRASHGLGLGLYICSQIVKKHKGKIGVTSTPGKGATFYFTLPVAAIPATKKAAAAKEVRQQKKRQTRLSFATHRTGAKSPHKNKDSPSKIA